MVDKIADKLAWPEDAPIPQEILDGIHDGVPSEYMDEIMASELVQHLRNYHTAIAGRRSARQIGDGPRAEQLAKLVAYSRNCISLIQHEHGNARAIADEIMVLEARATQRKRAEALKEEE